MNKFKLAHKLTRIFKKRHKDVDYKAQFAIFLRYIYKLEKKSNEELEHKSIPNWFIDQEGSGYAIEMMNSPERKLVKETEKAILVKFNNEFEKWVPKSILEDNKITHIDDFIKLHRKYRAA